MYQIIRITDREGNPKTDSASQKHLGCLGEAKMEEGCVLFHCTTGKDRTGIAAALLLLTLGVSREDVTRDFCLTNEYRAPVMAKVIASMKSALMPLRRAHSRLPPTARTLRPKWVLLRTNHARITQRSAR